MEEELPLGISRAHSRSNPLNVPRTSLSRVHSRQLSSKGRGALQVSSDVTQDAPDDQQESKSKRVKGLGLAGIATVFQAVMSVCAKLLGEAPFVSLPVPLLLQLIDHNVNVCKTTLMSLSNT